MDQRLQNLIAYVNDIKIQISNQQPTIKSHHVDMSINRHINFTKGAVELINDEAT